jgi:hypothetical protein
MLQATHRQHSQAAVPRQHIVKIDKYDEVVAIDLTAAHFKARAVSPPVILPCAVERASTRRPIMLAGVPVVVHDEYAIPKCWLAVGQLEHHALHTTHE